MNDRPQIQQHDVSINLRGLESHLEAQTAQIIDTRSKAEYVGLNASGNSRVGRVPGAFHFEWQEAINQKDNNKFLSKQELEKRIMTRFGLNKDKPTITYCQRGIRAAHTAFLLQELLGFKQVQVYEGSMMEYLNREDTKVEI
jgi:thiosulfate/3-mercaptopyruvate sulfurtransferase